MKQQRLAAVDDTFEAIADEFLAKVEREGSADVAVAKKRWLLGMAKAVFGRKPITEVTSADVLSALQKQEAAGNLETAKRLRSDRTGLSIRHRYGSRRIRSHLCASWHSSVSKGDA